MKGYRDTTAQEMIIPPHSLFDKAVRERVSKSVRLSLKRGMDLVMGLIVLIAGLPVFLVIALAVKCTSKGPVFFRQERIGHRGKLFQIIKFRTMVQKPFDDSHKEYIQQLLKNSKMTDDQVMLMNSHIEYIEKKVTAAGSFLRATSLDELPQLFNIIRGEMSFIGPRPHPTYEVDLYKDWYRRRLDVKPGLTGWSKLNLRASVKNYEEAILYDLWYVDHWNLRLDLKILIKTIPFVMTMKDAH